MRRRVFTILGIVFGGIGACMVAAALVFAVIGLSFGAGAERAEGTVVALVGQSRGLSPVVRFVTADGRAIEFTGTVASHPPVFAVGEKVSVLYRPEAPERASIDSFFQRWFFAFLFGVQGLAFSLLGGLFLFFLWRRLRLIAWLKRNGRPVTAQITSVEKRSLRRGGWYVFAQWQNPATQRLHVFMSDELGFNPTAALGSRPQVTVMIDPQRSKRYWMDLDFLPRLA